MIVEHNGRGAKGWASPHMHRSRSMTTKSNADVLAQHLAAEAVHDAEASAATYHDDGFYENAALGIRFEGRELVAFQYAASWDLIAGMKARYDWQVEVGDTIVQCGEITGTVGTDMLG